MNSFQPWSWIVTVSFALVVLLPNNQLAAEQSKYRVQPLRSSEDPKVDLICEFESPGLGRGGIGDSQSTSRWLQYDNPEALFSPQTIRTVRLQSPASKDPDANQDGHLTQDELETIDQSRRLELLRRYDSNADGILSRYELPEQLPEIEKEELKPERPAPQPNSPTVRPQFQNLRKFNMPSTRQPAVRSKPFAQAATFGARVGRPRSAGASASSCRSTRSNGFWYLTPVR